MAYLTSESIPLWFTLGKHLDGVVPTGGFKEIQSFFFPDTLLVYTLWKFPDILPILSIPGEKVPAMLHAPFLLDTSEQSLWLRL